MYLGLDNRRLWLEIKTAKYFFAVYTDSIKIKNNR